MKKILKRNLKLDVEIEAMHHEMNVLQRTEHPNLMKVYEILEDDVYFYLVCELVPGGDLERLLKSLH